jgi:hypothetical protein
LICRANQVLQDCGKFSSAGKPGHSASFRNGGFLLPLAPCQPTSKSKGTKIMPKAPSAREALMEKYVADLKEKAGEARPDIALLEACVKVCGPSIYRSDSALVAASDKSEIERVRTNFVGRRLGVKDDDRAAAAIGAAIDYLIAKELKKGAALKAA